MPNPAPHSAVDTTASPAIGGTTAGDGVYTNGTTTTVLASPSAGYRFVNWTENGTVVSTTAAYTFTNIVNRSLVAAFVPAPTISVTRQPSALLLTWPTNFSGYTLQQNTNLNTANWPTAAETVTPRHKLPGHHAHHQRPLVSSGSAIRDPGPDAPMKTRNLLLLASFLTVRAHAQSVLFDFDSAHSGLPAAYTVGGITASLAATGAGGY